MKNSEILPNAQKLLELARRQDFKDSEIQLIDDDDNVFSNVEDYVFEYADQGESNLRVYILLTNLTIDIQRDPDDEDAEPTVTFP